MYFKSTAEPFLKMGRGDQQDIVVDRNDKRLDTRGTEDGWLKTAIDNLKVAF